MDKIIERRKREAAQKEEEQRKKKENEEEEQRMKKEEEQRMKKKEEELQRAKNKHNKITPFSAEICAEKTEWPEKQRQLTEEEENAIADFVVGKEKEQYATMLEAHLKHWLAEGQEIIYQ